MKFTWSLNSVGGDMQPLCGEILALSWPRTRRVLKFRGAVEDTNVGW